VSITKPLTTAEVRMRVNGVEVVRTVEVRRTLADFLREDLSLTGTHLGCEHGVCGACTVLLDGQPVRSCLLFAVQAGGHEVTTVEALGTPEALSPLQQAFVEHHGLQCGFCTPGILMSAHALLRDHAHPTDEQIREVLGGHLCRCTGYQGIFDAVRAAADLSPHQPNR
jgi:carbon-monoxide dehydrogenase small subunit